MSHSEEVHRYTVQYMHITRYTGKCKTLKYHCIVLYCIVYCTTINCEHCYIMIMYMVT